jgi:cell division protein ZapE
VTPTEYYQKLIESDQILRDTQQEAVIQRLQIIYNQLVLTPKKPSLIQRITLKKHHLIKGLYLFGEVGIGKTFLMDVFFYCLPFKTKKRIHFHKFMKMVHEQLTETKHERQPLTKIAKKISKECSVICFDELVVNDIADAMLLAGLFDALYQEKICLIFTSNTAPDNLYLKGIQRKSFLPAIDLIKKNSEVLHISTREDYRLRNYTTDSFYYTPLNHHAEKMLEQQFATISHHMTWTTKPLRMYDRHIKVKKAAAGIVWFDFIDICGVPRSQLDYLEIAKTFHTILISHVQVIQPEQNDLARSFINLVDVLYDTNKKLIISAEKPIEQIYYCGKMLFEFSRTRSRLIEMQTSAWQQKCRSE